MAVEDTFAAIGASGLFSGGFSLFELAIFAGMAFFFACSLALAIMSARAANSARRARGEAQGVLASIESQTAELRALAGDLERTASDLAGRQTEIQEFQASTQKSLSDEATPAPVAGSGSGPIERRYDPLPPKEEGREAADRQSLGETEEPRPAGGAKSALLRGLLRRR